MTAFSNENSDSQQATRENKKTELLTDYRHPKVSGATIYIMCDSNDITVS